ncbi:hypothetical protein [uncultured Nostoc sp.]|uniref:hypothetical protein n=1 Tax=uncultured Nostoc sp. TaxID=340711 RepID=UPI0026305139|nr:hypothetical protein [uncultured Nostoc sp.]
MNKLCRDPNYFIPKIHKEYRDLKDKIKSDFIVKGLKLDNSLIEVIPAYRWRCAYKLKNQSNLREGGSRPNPIDLGLSMDESICEKILGYKKRTVAVPLHYDNPDSIHCILTN